jgi:hypothetical protein
MTRLTVVDAARAKLLLPVTYPQTSPGFTTKVAPLFSVFA